MSDGKSVIWTPDGMVTIGEKQNERVELRPGVGEWLRQFQDVATALNLGLHCSLCDADIVGKNSDDDRVYSVACGCREFIWTNRDYRPGSGTKH